MDGDTRYGVNDYIDMIMNRKVTKLTVNWFIKSRNEARDLIEGKSAKKSRKPLILPPEIINGLDMNFNDVIKISTLCRYMECFQSGFSILTIFD